MDDSSTKEYTPVSGQDLFNAPKFRYLRKRETFLKMFRNGKIWGKHGSKQRVIALQEMINYIRETNALGETDSEVKMDALVQNIHLIYKGEVLPHLPDKLRRNVVAGSRENENYEDKLDKILDALEEEKEASLRVFELHESWRINDYENYDKQEAIGNYVRQEVTSKVKAKRNNAHKMKEAAFD